MRINETPQAMIQKAATRENIQFAVVATLNGNGWEFNYSEMPIELLCFARELLTNAINARVSQVMTGGMVEAKERTK